MWLIISIRGDPLDLAKGILWECKTKVSKVTCGILRYLMTKAKTIWKICDSTSWYENHIWNASTSATSRPWNWIKNKVYDLRVVHYRKNSISIKYGIVRYGMVQATGCLTQIWLVMVWHSLVWYGMVWYGMVSVSYTHLTLPTIYSV